MTTTMDHAGRLVLPKAARDQARLRPGMPLEVRVVDGRIEIEPAAAAVTIEKRSGFWVATPAAAVPQLTGAQVDRTIDEVREPNADAPGE